MSKIIWFFGNCYAMDGVIRDETLIEKDIDAIFVPNLGRRRDELIPSLRSFPVEDYLIFYFPLENGIEIARVVNGYRDLDAMFDVD